MKVNCFLYYTLLVFGVIFYNPLAHSTVYGAAISGVGTTCAAGYKGVLKDYGLDTGCGWAQGVTGENKAKILWGAGQVFKPSASNNFSGVVYGFEKGYAPFSSYYKMRIYFCPSLSQGTCSQSAAVQYFDSNASVFLNSTQLIVNQDPDFSGYSGILSSSSNSCLVLIDEAMNAWKSEGEFFCQDARNLPEVGATCYLNHENDLNIDMGRIERSEIQTNAESSNHHVNKEFLVLCTGDAGTAVTIQFVYENLSLVNGDAIKSSADGLGIMMKYNGEYVNLNKVFNRNYNSGYTTEMLDFYAIRDSLVPLSDIPAGDFTAHAVMILTLQ